MHDPAILACAADSEWLRRLARRLVDDTNGADDVAQEAALQALRASRSSRGWLAGVVRNLAANRRRAEGRRARHESLAATDEAQPSAADTAARVEEQRKLAAAVLALEPPFRDIVLLRFYDGLERREIAARMQVPIATVNSRLTRAIEKLRRHLDRSCDGDRSRWTMALAPLLGAGNQREVLAVGATWFSKKSASMAAAAALLGVTGIAVLAVGDRGGSGNGLDGLPVPTASLEAAADEGGERADTVDERALRRSSVPTAASAAGGVRVTVVDGDTGRAVPAAEVRWVDLEEEGSASRQANDARRMRYEPFFDFAFEVGSPRLLDASASFVLHPAPEGIRRGLLFARHGERRGVLPVSQASVDQDLELVLGATRQTRVRVVDAAGRPCAGVPVALWMHHGDVRVPGELTASGPDGTLLLRWFDRLLLMDSRQPEGSVGLAFPGGEHVSEPITVTAPPEEIVLRCPAVGTVRVTVTESGRAAADGTMVRLDGETESPAGFPIHRRRTIDGMATFWPVGLGQRCSAQLSDVPAWATSSGPGPARANEIVDIRLDGRRVTLTARLLEADGALIADHSATARTLPGQLNGWRPILSDSDGSVALTAWMADAGLPADAEITIALGAPRFDHVTVKVPSCDEDVVDLGEVRFAPRAVWVRGTVVDASGQPIAGASVRAGADTSDPAGGTRRFPTVETDAAGRFELVGDERPATFWLAATHPRGHGRRRRVHVDAQADVRIVLEHAGVLEGRLALPEGAPALDFELELWPEALGAAPARPVGPTVQTAALNEAPARADHPAPEHVFVEIDGRFRSVALAPGRYTLIVSLRDSEIIRVTGLSIDAHATARPPALQPLDLTHVLQVIRLDVRDAAGHRMQGTATARIDGRQRELGRSDRPILLDIRHAPSELTVEAEGFFSAEVDVTEAHHAIELTRGHACVVHLAGAQQLLETHRVEARLEPLSSDPELAAALRGSHTTRRPHRAEATADGTVALRAPAAGRYRVRLFLHVEPPDSFPRWIEITPGSTPLLDVAGNGHDECIVTIEEARVRAALNGR